MEHDQQRFILKALHEAANEIEEQVFGLSDAQLRSRPSDDEWSLKENLLHLRDAEEVYLRWFRLIAGHEEPDLPDVDIEDYPAERDYQSADVYDALTAFARLRRQTAHLLWPLSSLEWERSGRHPFRGRLTIEALAREMNRHDLEHLWQMRRLRQAVEDEEVDAP